MSVPFKPHTVTWTPVDSSGVSGTPQASLACYVEPLREKSDLARLRMFCDLGVMATIAPGDLVTFGSTVLFATKISRQTAGLALDHQEVLLAETSGLFAAYSQSLASDGYGGQTETYSSLVWTVYGILETAGAGIAAEIGARIGGRAGFVLHTVPRSWAPSMRVTSGGSTYEVVEVGSKGSLDALLPVWLARID